MRHILSLLIFLLIFSTQSFIIRAQDVNRFVEGYKSAYENHLKKARLDTSLTYIPSVMNLAERKYSSWHCLSSHERQQKLWSYICPPILANDFAFEITKGKYYFFPEGWLYHNLPRYRVNEIVEHPDVPLFKQTLLKYLQNNQVEYIFTIVNVGDGSIDGRYWVITNNQLYILRYNKDIDELFPVEAIEFLNENIAYFEPMR